MAQVLSLVLALALTMALALALAMVMAQAMALAQSMALALALAWHVHSHQAPYFFGVYFAACAQHGPDYGCASGIRRIHHLYVDVFIHAPTRALEALFGRG